ncbi:MAG: hypothetical protein IPH28_09450 [Cytophagaceae bacterium]|nr:hypothetical protein [Cytophagaceae bacterium]
MSKILGVFGQTLVVVGYIREYTYMLLGLDVQSGQVLWKEEIFAAELWQSSSCKAFMYIC